MDDLRQAEVRFHAAQEKLKDFIQQNMEFRIDTGLSFVATHDSERLDREYTALKLEHDEAGAAWAAAIACDGAAMNSMDTMMESSADALGRLIAEKCFQGYLPPFPSEIVEAVVQCLPCVRDADEATAQQFADELCVALRERLRVQAVSETAEFQN